MKVKNVKKTEKVKLLPLIIDILKPHRGKMIVIFLANLLASAIILTVPLFLREITTLIEGSRTEMVDINFLILLLSGLFIFHAFLSFLGEFLTESVGEQITLTLREYFFEKILLLPIATVQKYSSGELTARLTDDVKAVRRVVTESSVQIIKNALMTLVIIVLLIIINPMITLVIFGTVLLIGIGATFIANSIKQMSISIQESHSKLISQANEALMNLPIIKAFVRENFILEKYQQKSKEILQLIIKRTRLIALVRPLTNLLAFIAIMLSFWFAITKVVDGTISGSDLIAYFGYAFILASSISLLTSHLGTFHKESGTIQELMQFTSSHESERKEGRDEEINNLSGEITFDHVEFTYPDGSEVLKDLTFTIEKNSTVALVGPSGVGKSTIVNLLLKIYEPSRGDILLDGRSMKHIDPTSLRKEIGVVLQHPFLFEMSIYENILFGNPKATFEEVVAAAKAANIHSFIESLPKKYQTNIGEMGSKLSRGQAQRIAIARMILKDPSILILDEATASLDNENEKLIYHTLKQMMKHRTTIIISHKLALLQGVHRIFYLSDGQIVEEGTHDGLMENKAYYYQMYVQLEKEIVS